MPTYEYECKSCGHNFDAFQNIKDEPLKTCPKCGKEELHRLINGGTGIIFKGSGFYATDKGGSAVKSAKAEEPAKSESAPCPACAKSESCPKAVNS